VRNNNNCVLAQPKPSLFTKTIMPKRPKTIEGTVARLSVLKQIKSVNLSGQPISLTYFIIFPFNNSN